MRKKYNFISLIIACIFITYVLLYISWSNRVTYIKHTYIRDGEFVNEVITLTRKEVRPYFNKLSDETGQNALVNIAGKLPSEKFNVIRELKNQILLYKVIAARCHEVLLIKNADYYYIDTLGLAYYCEFYSDLRELSSDIICSSPSYQKIYKPFKTTKLDIFENSLEIKSLNRPFWAGLLSYPIVVDNQKNVYININYLHDNSIFPGKYNNATYDPTCDNIRYNDKNLLIDDSRSIVTIDTDKFKDKPINCQDNSIISDYKIYKLNGLKYINVNVIQDLYNYEIDKTFVATSDLYGNTFGMEYSFFYKVSNFIKPFNFGTIYLHPGTYIGCYLKIDDTDYNMEKMR